MYVCIICTSLPKNNTHSVHEVSYDNVSYTCNFTVLLPTQGPFSHSNTPGNCLSVQFICAIVSELYKHTCKLPTFLLTYWHAHMCKTTHQHHRWGLFSQYPNKYVHSTLSNHEAQRRLPDSVHWCWERNLLSRSILHNNLSQGERYAKL